MPLNSGQAAEQSFLRNRHSNQHIARDRKDKPAGLALKIGLIKNKITKRRYTVILAH